MRMEWRAEEGSGRLVMMMIDWREWPARARDAQI